MNTTSDRFMVEYSDSVIKQQIHNIIDTPKRFRDAAFLDKVYSICCNIVLHIIALQSEQRNIAEECLTRHKTRPLLLLNRIRKIHKNSIRSIRNNWARANNK